MLVVFLHGWTCAQTISLQVSAIPTAATRLIAVIDQGGLPSPVRFVKDVAAGVSTSTFAVAVPAGGPYRVRAIAFTAGLAYPAILRSGKAAGVLVPNGTTVSASITLAGLAASLDSATPASASAGSTVSLAANINDPGDTGAGASATRLYSLTTPLPGNHLGDDRMGPFERIGEGIYRLSATIATPQTGMSLNYQFAFNAWDFNDANKVEQPYLFWPNLSAGQTPLVLASQASSSISLTVSGLPSSGNRIVAVVDGAGLQSAVRVVKDYTVGQSSLTMSAEVPAGSAYRIRLATFAAGTFFPIILRTGKATGLTAPGSTTVALSDPVFTPLAGTPTSAPAGSTLTLEATMVDPGEVAAGMPVASLYSRTAAFTTNLDGTESRGVLEALGSGNYHLSVPLALPSIAATTYYQFAANAYDFDDPSGRESPHLCWPNLQAGQALRQLASTQTSAIRITISGIPSTATRIIAAVDQGGLATPVRTAISFTVGQPPANVTLGVPPGGPYRVRLIAIRSGSSTPVILRAGKAAVVSVVSGATATASVTLSDYTVSIDPATPSNGLPGSTVTVIANATDPGDTASDASAARLYSASSAFLQNMSVTSVTGLVAKNPDGTMKLTAQVVLPGQGSTLYYQLAYEALDFSDADGVERPFFCWPNLESAQSLRQIATSSTQNLYTISGTVKLNGAPLSGVSVGLAGAGTASMVTAPDGAYSFPLLPAGSYTVTATRSNFTFAPASASVPLTASRTVDFTATQSLAAISVALAGLPPTGNRLVAILDGAGLSNPVRVVKSYTAGQTTAALGIDAPAASGYRIRVVAFAAGDTHPSILRSGQSLNVAAPSSISFVLTDATFTPLAGTPTSAAAGSTVNLDLTLLDPGNAVAGVAVSSVFSQTQVFTTNLSGTETRGTLASAGQNTYRLSVPLTLPATAASSYYQFSVNAFDFNEPAGTESPCYFWPDPQAGQTLNQIASTLPTGIRILVNGTPATATRLIAVTDQGPLTQPVRTVASFSAGKSPASITVGVPAGSPYRVRLIAFQFGSANPIILRSGRATGISVPSNAMVDAAVTLTDYTVALAPDTPTSGIPGSSVTVIANVTDPGDTGSNVNVSGFYGDSAVFTQNLSPNAVAGTLEDSGGGILKLTSTVVLPAGSAFYYQLAFEALDFAAASGNERPYFCWPNLEAAQALKQIQLSPVYTLAGKVTLNGAPRSGVTVSLSGLRTSSVVTGADGAYAFAGLPAGSYTVVPSRVNFTFSPASSTITLAFDRSVNFSVTQVTGTITVSRSVLRFGATLGGASTTATQEIAVDVSDNLPVNWTVTPDHAWLRTAPGSGTGSGSFIVSVNAAAIPPAGIATGKITLNTNTTTSAQIVIQVYLAVAPSTGAPFGTFDTPASGGVVLSSSIPVTGWALDDVGVKKVEVWRDPIPKEPTHPNGLVYIGDAIFVPDARPDVAALYADRPNNYRAGWGYLMLTNFLPNPTGGPAGNGTYKLHAIAEDEEGKRTELGVKTITVNNASATKPFGTIDSPAPGEMVSGTAYNVTGWALTPQPYKVAESGNDIWVAIDGAWVANVSYNGYRSDIAALFPTYANAGGSAGTYLLDTTRYSNGMHSIAWAVTDTAGRSDGLGSRYFFIRNTVPAVQAPTPILAMAAVDAATGADIEIEEMGRVELQLPRGSNWSGRLVHNDDRVPLPVGSTLDSEGGVFVWQLAPGFLGEYRLEFTSQGESKTVRIVVRPLRSTADLPKEGQVRF